MKNFTKSVAALFIALGVLTSCDQSLTEEIIASENSSELSNEEIKSAVETMSFKYSISALEEDDTEVIISSDEELTAYGDRTGRPRIVFPIDITVDGETITVNSKEEMKALVGEKKRRHRKPPFELVFPVSVATAEGELAIEDKEAFKAYRESLEEDTKPAFVYPISVVFEEETIVINSEEELLALKPERPERPTRPELVFPVSVVTADGNVEIADADAMKAYKETLEEGVRPEFVFPISLIIDEETVTVNSEEELEALKPERPARPELVFPVSVVTADGDLEIADADALKAYAETLEEGVRPEFVFPISLIIDEETVTVNNEDELKALKPKKRRRK
ncbi:hypothetical protein [Flavicella marina]|uniref:hypothetical protein n=1 Tax=Flavicella marina TaxID=1475951 RepID=UPI001264D8E3|nr:hypothetical protein [Flavicella marina]